MNRLEYICRYELRHWIEGGIMTFYFYTAGIGPAIVGYSAARWCPRWLRLVPLLFILPAGVFWVWYSGHFFGIYLLGNTCYVVGTVVGLYHRAKKENKRFWNLGHVDWMSVAGATIVMALAYVKPKM